MQASLPPPSWLRTFGVAARHMSFTRAAEELHVTQSAVSQQIRLLEDRLGQPLFHRLPQSLQLTEAGKAYLPVVREAFERLAFGTEEVFGIARQGLVTVRATPGFAEFWLAPRLEALFAAYPELELRVTSTIWNTDSIESGVDLEVRYGLGEWGELEAACLTREHLVPVCSPGVAARLQGDPRHLARVRLLHTDGFRNGWPEWLDAAGVARHVDGGSGCHFDTAILPLRLAEEGLGVALGRSSMIGQRLHHGRLVAPFDTPVPTREAFHLCWPSDTPLHPDAEIVRDWLIASATEPTAIRTSGP